MFTTDSFANTTTTAATRDDTVCSASTSHGRYLVTVELPESGFFGVFDLASPRVKPMRGRLLSDYDWDVRDRVASNARSSIFYGPCISPPELLNAPAWMLNALMAYVNSNEPLPLLHSPESQLAMLCIAEALCVELPATKIAVLCSPCGASNSSTLDSAAGPGRKGHLMPRRLQFLDNDDDDDEENNDIRVNRAHCMIMSRRKSIKVDGFRGKEGC